MHLSVCVHVVRGKTSSSFLSLDANVHACTNTTLLKQFHQIFWLHVEILSGVWIMMFQGRLCILFRPGSKHNRNPNEASGSGSVTKIPMFLKCYSVSIYFNKNAERVPKSPELKVRHHCLSPTCCCTLQLSWLKGGCYTFAFLTIKTN